MHNFSTMKTAKLLFLVTIVAIYSCKSNSFINKKSILCDCKDWQAKADKEFQAISNSTAVQSNQIMLNDTPNRNVEKKFLKRKKFRKTKAKYAQSKRKNKKRFEKISKCFNF